MLQFWVGLAILLSVPRVSGADTWRPRATLSSDDPATAMAFAPGGKTIAVAYGRPRGNSFSPNTPGRILLWDVTKDRPASCADFKLPTTTGSIAFAPDGRTLAVIYGANLRLIDVLSGRYKAALWPERSVSGRGLFVLGPVNFSSDGETLAVSSRPKLVLGDVTTGKVRVEIPFFQGKAFQFGPPSHVFAPDGKSFAILDEHDGGVTILESSDGRLRTRLKDRKDDVLNFRYSPDGKMLAVKTLDGRISLSETSLGLQKTSFATAPGAFPMLEFAPDGRTLATTGPDQSIRLLDVGTGRETAILRGHTGVVLSLAYSPDGRAIASGGADKSVRVWDTVTGQEVAALTGHKGDDQVGPFGDVLRLEFSPDGKTLASYGQVETVRLWSRGP